MNDYIYIKLIQFFVFNDEAIRHVSNVNSLIFTQKFLDSLTSYVKYLVEKNYLIDDFKNNLNKLLDYMLENDIYVSDKRKLHVYINYLSEKTKNANGKNISLFYQEEISKRMIKIPLIINNKKQIEIEKRLKKSLAYDYLLLINIINNKKIEVDDLSIVYYSLNALIKEASSINIDDSHKIQLENIKKTCLEQNKQDVKRRIFSGIGI